MCTGIRLIAQDGTVVYARTLEFSVDVKSEVLVTPKGWLRTGTVPMNQELAGIEAGAKWTTKYASVGANAFGLDILADGLNSAGLAAWIFYLPTFAWYMPYSEEKASKTIAPWELGSWILDQYATVEEVKENIEDLVVTDVVLQEMGFAPPLHCVVHDSSGKSIAIEYVDGKLNVHENPLGVLTNSPTFDWHMTNLRNYINFSVTNLPPLTLDRTTTKTAADKPVTLEAFGQGTGMLGMPGDITPPSRFVRAVAFSQSILPELLKTGNDAVVQAFHILNNFDIPKGMARASHNGNIEADYSMWTSANDLKEKRFYFRTYKNSQIRVVNLMDMDLEAGYMSKIPMDREGEHEEFETVTPMPVPMPAQ